VDRGAALAPGLHRGRCHGSFDVPRLHQAHQPCVADVRRVYCEPLPRVIKDRSAGGRTGQRAVGPSGLSFRLLARHHLRAVRAVPDRTHDSISTDTRMAWSSLHLTLCRGGAMAAATVRRRRPLAVICTPPGLRSGQRLGTRPAEPADRAAHDAGPRRCSANRRAAPGGGSPPGPTPWSAPAANPAASRGSVGSVRLRRQGNKCWHNAGCAKRLRSRSTSGRPNSPRPQGPALCHGGPAGG